MPQIPKYELEPLNLGNETIAERITHIRKQQGLSQSELANKIGISRESVAAYESGRVRLFDEMVTRFALALKVSADLILGLKKINYMEPSLSLRVMRRIKDIENLSEKDKKSVLRKIDELIRLKKNDR